MDPLFVFQVTSDDVSQDVAPSYADLQQNFNIALDRAMAPFSGTKTAGIQWAGPIRVTRKVREGHLPGGTTSAVGVLVRTGSVPSIMVNTTQYQAFILAIQNNLRSLVQGSVGTGNRVLHVYVTDYAADVAHNGPLSFWMSGQDAVTHTRDRFPQYNLLGEVSADQNENPIGPNDASLVPIAAPANVSLSTLTALEIALAATAVIAGAYMLAPLFRSKPTYSTSRYRQAY